MHHLDIRPNTDNTAALMLDQREIGSITFFRPSDEWDVQSAIAAKSDRDSGFCPHCSKKHFLLNDMAVKLRSLAKEHPALSDKINQILDRS